MDSIDRFLWRINTICDSILQKGVLSFFFIFLFIAFFKSILSEDFKYLGRFKKKTLKNSCVEKTKDLRKKFFAQNWPNKVKYVFLHNNKHF